MLNYFYKNGGKLRRLRANPLVDILEEMAKKYYDWKVSPITAFNRLRPAADFGEWLQKRQIPPQRVTALHAQCFLATYVPPQTQKKGLLPRTPSAATRTAVRTVLDMLQKRWPPPAIPLSPREILWRQFEKHLIDHRGIRPSTIRLHRYVLIPFLISMFGDGPIRIAELDPLRVQEYVVGQRERYCLRVVAGRVVGTLRVFFRFCALQGIVTDKLETALPCFRRPRPCLSQRIVSDDHLRLLWTDAFDRSTPIGKRNYAALRCLTDLGMRVGDVAELPLDAVNWQKAIVCVANQKGKDPVWLPLPATVGEALADYIQHGRPISASRQIFLRHYPPCGTPGTALMISGAIRKAYIRVGLGQYYSSTHVLRHTAATRMRRAGVPFKIMADILGHGSIHTTALYAQVDRSALQAVSQPWPEEMS